MMGDVVPWVCRARGDQQSAAGSGALLLQLLPRDAGRGQHLQLRAGGQPLGQVSGGGRGRGQLMCVCVCVCVCTCVRVFLVIKEGLRP